MKLSHYAVIASLIAATFYIAIELRNQIKAENIKNLEAKVSDVVIPLGQVQEKPYEEVRLRDYIPK